MSESKPKQRFAIKRPMLLTLGAILISSLVATGFVWAQKTVTVVQDNQVQQLTTTKSTVKEVIYQAQVFVGPEDEVTPGLSAKVNHNMVITVRKPVTITVSNQGQTSTVRTAKATVGEVVAALGMTQGYKTVPEGSAEVTAGMTVMLVKVSEEVLEREVVVPHAVERRADEQLEQGVTKVQQQGQDGLKKQKVKIYYENGQQVKTEVIEEQVVKEPVTERVTVGSITAVQTSRGSARFSRVISMEATAYTPYDGSGEGITATGIKARWGVVAVDPRVIPLGTRVYIPGYGEAIAADTGGAIIGNKIDLCMEDYSQCMSFGRRYVKVYVLE